MDTSDAPGSGERESTTRKRRQFTDEFKAEAVALVLEQGVSVWRIGRDLDLSKTSLRNWVEQAQADAGESASRLTTAERDELRTLRKKGASSRWSAKS